MDQKDLSAQQKFWGKDVKFESKLAEKESHEMLKLSDAKQ